MQDNRAEIPETIEELAVLLLPAEQVKERAELIAKGFPGWTRNNFYTFVDGLALYGRNKLALVAPMVR